MKGIILAGGTGSRLYPLTKAVNKHLLPVYHKPMIFYAIEAMAQAGIEDILVILGGESTGEFITLLGSGKSFGVNLTYRFQDEAGGIAHALDLAENFANNDKILVILGDNIFEYNLKNDVEVFCRSDAKAGIFLKKVVDPERYGIAEIKDDKVINIVEKPENPESNWAVTGIYMYTPQVFEVIKTIIPSDRGELEITDVNNVFVKDNSLLAFYLEGYWIDAGKFESLYLASSYVRQFQNKGGGV